MVIIMSNLVFSLSDYVMKINIESKGKVKKKAKD